MVRKVPPAWHSPGHVVQRIAQMPILPMCDRLRVMIELSQKNQAVLADLSMYKPYHYYPL